MKPYWSAPSFSKNAPTTKATLGCSSRLSSLTSLSSFDHELCPSTTYFFSTYLDSEVWREHLTKRFTKHC